MGCFSIRYFHDSKSEHSQVMRFTLNHGSAGVKHQARRRRREWFWRPWGGHPTPISRHPNSAVRSEGTARWSRLRLRRRRVHSRCWPDRHHGTHTLTDLFELTGRRLEDYIELMEVQPMYRLIWSDGDRFDYVRDEARWLNKSPNAVKRTLKGTNGSLNTPRRSSRKGTPIWLIALSQVLRHGCRVAIADASRATVPSTRRSPSTSKTTTSAKP